MRALSVVCLSACVLACSADQPLSAAAPPRENVQELPSACAKTQACGGDPVGRWRIASMCTRAPEIMFAAYTSVPFASCRGQVHAADLEVQGNLTVAASLALSLDYQLESRLTVVWSARCLNADALDEVQCHDVEEALRAHAEVQELQCSLHDQECACSLRPSLHVAAADLRGAREMFAAAEHCARAERMSMDDGSATLQLERADSEP